MLSKLTSREKNLLIILSFVLIGVVCYKYVFQPQFSKMNQLEKAYAAEEKRLIETKKVADSYNNVAFEAKTKQKNLESIKSRLLTNASDGSKEVKLGLDAKDKSVRVGLFQPLEAITNEDYIELPIRMEIKGEYSQILEFITAVQSFYNVTEIKDLVLKNEKPEELSSTPQLKASFTFSIYTTNPPEEFSSYTDLSQWTVGRINSFSAGIKALANFDPSVGQGNLDTTKRYYPNYNAPQRDEDIILK